MEHIEHLLAAYHDAELPERTRRHVEAHLEACPRCRDELSHLEALSLTLAAYAVPHLDSGVQQFRAQVALRLARRRPAATTASGWWYLVPLALSCVLVGLLALFTLPDLLRVAWVLLEWIGVEPGALLELRIGVQLSRGAVAVLRSVGTLAWVAALYAALLLLFGSYVGWVSVLWRTKARPRSGKER
ncbi:MAG TPA: zf-HC2 domain-containing protein [Anaerolineae bacterium]|nr:zf-HC2 domain-containing protein [Anaerolineae bacterium]